MNIKRSIYLIAFLFISLIFLNPCTVYADDFSVIWTDALGVEAFGSSLTKTGSVNAWDSGAASTLSFTGDGGVRFTATETNTHRMLGLSTENVDVNYTGIDYAVHLVNNGNVMVYENGVSKGIVSTYNSGDILSVERIGTAIQYKKNSTVMYTSLTAVDNTQSLLVDVSIYTNGGTITDTQLIGVTPAVPETITDLGAEVADQQIILRWTDANNNGSELTEYEVQYGTVASGAFGTIITDDTNAGITITGLTNGTEYQFKVYAKNSIGTSEVSNVVAASPDAITDVVWKDVVNANVSSNSLTKTGSANAWDSGAASTLSFTGDGGVRFTATETNTHRMLGLSAENVDANYTGIDYAVYLVNNGNVMVYENGVSKGIVSTYENGDIFSIERTGTVIKYKKNSIVIYTSSSVVDNFQSLLVDVALHTSGATITEAQFVGVAPAVPETITDLGAEVGDQQVFLSWSESNNNGSELTEYEVQYGTVASGAFGTIITDDTTAGITITGLTNGIEYQFKVYAKNAIGSSDASNVVRATPNTISDVVWTDLVGVNADGNSLTKSGVTSAWDSGAASTLSFTGDGGVRFTANETNTHRMLGLSTKNVDVNYIGIDYAVYLVNNGNVMVYENGVSKGIVSTYKSGDILSVERIGTAIQYKKNSIVIYTSATTIDNTQSLLVDASIHTNDGTITEAQFVGVTPDVPETITDLGAEVADGSIILAWSKANNNGSLLTEYEVQYGTVASGAFGTIITDDTNAGITITGLTNGTEYQFKVYAKNAIGSSDASNVVRATPNTISDVVWTDLVGVNADGNSLTKTETTTGWDSGAASTLSFTGDGAVRFTATETNKYRMLGLSTENADANYTSIDYAIYLVNNGNVMVYENGASKGIVSTYKSGDVLSVERVGTSIQYKKNSTVIYTSTSSVSSIQSLLVDVSLHTSNATITNAQFIGVTPPPIVYSEDLCVDGASSASSCFQGCSSAYSHTAAFDDVFNVWDGWVSDGGQSGWIGYEFATAQKIAKYTINPRGQVSGNPRDWTFEGYNETTQQWVVLDTRAGETWTYQVTKEFTFNNSNSYKSYRINVSANGGHSEIGLTEIEMMAVLGDSGVPDAIDDLTATVGDGQVILDWTTPDNGTTITEYEIQYGTVASSTFGSTLIVGDTTPGVVVTGLTNGEEYQFRVISTNSYGTSDTSNVATATPAEPLIIDVVWTDKVGVTANGNSLIQTAGSSGWNIAGAASIQSFAGNGGVKFTVSETSTHRMFGLSANNEDVNYTTIDYAVYMEAPSSVVVFENGINRGTFGSYQTGDVYSVERVETEIQYKRNDVLFYTSTVAVASETPLLADTALHTNGATITNAQFFGIQPFAPEPVDDLATDIGNQQITLNWTEPPTNGAAITEYEIQYGTVASSLFDTIVTDDNTPGATVSGLTNGVEYQFRVIAKNTAGSSGYSNVVTVMPNQRNNVVWSDTIGVSVIGNSLIKNTGSAWGNSSAASTQNLIGNGEARFIVGEADKSGIFGLSTKNRDNSYGTVEYGIYLSNGGIVYVYENGVSRGDFNSYQAGDIFSIERIGTTINYKQNNVAFYSTFNADDSGLLVDTALYSEGASINNAELIGVIGLAPSKVVGLAAADQNAQVDLTWSAVTGASGYYVKFGIESGVYGVPIDVGNILGYTVTGLTNGTTYYFVVSAYNGNGEGQDSKEVMAIPNDNDSGTMINYTYDNRNRLIQSQTVGSKTIDYDYDDVGNILDKDVY